MSIEDSVATPPSMTLLVLAKEPIAGKVKTRLAPAVTLAEAAILARAALMDTLETVLRAPATRRILVLDGDPGDWVPAGFEVIPQVGGGLDRRLAGAFAAVEGPAMLIGMDTPQVSVADLTVSFDDHGAWLGLTDDGGFWGVAMQDPLPSVFIGVPMSTDVTGAHQLSRMKAAGMKVGMLEQRRDVDAIEDAHAVAELVPRSRFALELDYICSQSNWGGDDLYGAALRDGTSLFLIAADGRKIDLDVDRWRSEPDEADLSLLSRCSGATLDVGCGPGRFTIALARRGEPSLGVDVTEAAVNLTRQGGASALCRSIFDPLPGEGRWDTVLLADGNLGIAGDPHRLLRRIRELLRPGGTLLVEPAAAEVNEILPMRLGTAGLGAPGPEFAWAHLGPTAATEVATLVGFSHAESWSVGERHFRAFVH